MFDPNGWRGHSIPAHEPMNRQNQKQEAVDASTDGLGSLGRAALQSEEESLELALRPAEEEEVCLKQWEVLEQQLGHDRLTSQVVWVRGWLSQYRDLVACRFAVGKAGGRVVGIALVVTSNHQRRGPFTLRTVHLGTAGEPQAHSVVVEFNTLLVEQAWEKAFIDKLLNTLGAEAGGWDEIRLDGIDPNDWKSIERFVPSFDCEVVKHAVVKERRYCDLAALRDRGGDVLSMLGSSTRSNIKRRLKQYKALEVEWAKDLPEAVAIFEELQFLHQDRWQKAGGTGAFASERFTRFQRGLLEDLFDDGRVVVFRARDGQQTIGCLFLLVEQGRLLDYLSGFAPFEQGTSPGLVTHYLCMQEALKRGYLAYDFLIGEKRQKENLGKSVGELHWVSWNCVTWKLRLCDAFRWARGGIRPLLNAFKGYAVGDPLMAGGWLLQF